MLNCKKEGYRPADFRHEITIEGTTLTADDSGGQTEGAWTEVGTVWAYIRSSADREAIFADRKEEFVKHEIRIRYIEGIDATMRVRLGDRIFQIQSVVNEDERNEFLLMRTHEKAGS